MKLSELKIGDKGRVVKINSSNKILKRRMLDMGVNEGALVTIKKIAPLGDPICFELRGYELCLRKKDLSSVEVIRE